MAVEANSSMSQARFGRPNEGSPHLFKPIWVSPQEVNMDVWILLQELPESYLSFDCGGSGGPRSCRFLSKVDPTVRYSGLPNLESYKPIIATPIVREAGNP